MKRPKDRRMRRLAGRVLGSHNACDEPEEIRRWRVYRTATGPNLAHLTGGDYGFLAHTDRIGRGPIRRGRPSPR